MIPPHERPRVLVVEDDLSVAEGLIRGLGKAGFETSLAMAGDEGLTRILHERFDLVLLDLMLPEKSGFEILETVRTRVSVPIVVLSARTDLPSRLRSFDQGAVDFVPKPFFMEELVARIRARLALTAATPSRTLPLADVVVDLDARVVTRDGEDLGLTAHEFNVVAFLREHAGRAYSRQQIAEHALPEDGDRIDRTLDTHISRIRKKLGPAGAHLRTVWAIGYKIDLEPR
ncbi:MAG: response regulator transcription factor [Alphaproteobacteria bacterium]|nr:response regulator transcription factor [Alphaproteobacteria bacterium]